jgi:hypothetical protein
MEIEMKKNNRLALVYFASFVICAMLFRTAHAQVLFNATIGAEFAPNVFGQINTGNAPPPPVLYPQPIIAGQEVYGAAPMYIYAPIEETQNWGFFCNKYRACGVPVYFVSYEERHPFWNRYHEEHHLPNWQRERFEERREPLREERGEFRDDRREERREERREDRRER